MGSIFACQSTPKESLPMKCEKNWNALYQAKQSRRLLKRMKAKSQDVSSTKLLAKKINFLDKIIKHLENDAENKKKKKKEQQILNRIKTHLDITHNLCDELDEIFVYEQPPLSDDDQAEVDKMMEQMNDEIALEIRYSMPIVPTTS